MGKDQLADVLGDLRHYGIAESSQSVHPRGNPISHSTHVGFKDPLTSEPRSFAAFRALLPPPIVIPEARGAGH